MMSEHPRSLKESITYSQALCVKRICYTNSEVKAQYDTIKDQFIKRRYEKTLVENQIKKVEVLDRSVLLVEQSKVKKASCLPFSVTYNWTLTNIKNILQQHWIMLKVVSATFLLVCFVYLKESTREARKNVFYFTLKALFVLEIIKF